jgi:hypothetical protein
MEKLQRQIESQVHERLHLQSCASKLGDRPADLKKVRREMERGGTRVRAALGRLKQWKDELADSSVFSQRAETTKATGGFGSRSTRGHQSGSLPEVPGASGSEEWRVERILRGDFPWLDDGQEPNAHSSVGLRLKRKLTSLDEDRQRGEEEKAVVELEIKRTLLHYKQQVANLGKRLAALELEKESVLAGSQKDYILGSTAIVSLKKRRLESLLARAEILFENVNKPLSGAALGAAAVEEVNRSTRDLGDQSDSENESDVEGGFEEVDDDFQ